jgi:hypothetical protein
MAPMTWFLRRVRWVALALIAAGVGVGAGALAGGSASAAGRTMTPGETTPTRTTTTGETMPTRTATTAETTTTMTTATTPVCGASEPPNKLVLLAGSPQTTTLGSAFATRFQVSLTNSDGCPVSAAAGIPVTFSAPTSGASGTFSASGSDTLTLDSNSAGSIAAATFIANQITGNYNVTASSPYGSVSLELMNSCPASEAPNELVLAGGTPQTAQLDAAFAEPLQVALVNTNGCPVTAVAGTPVTFQAPASGPSATFKASGSDTLTVGAGSQGSAQAGPLTANDTPGSYAITATSAYGSVSFSLTNTAAGLPTSITPTTPASQAALVKTRYAEPLAVRVTDANGTPVVGAPVTFSLGGGGTGGGAAGGGGGTEHGGGGGDGGDSSTGAGASFAGGSTQATESTNSEGLATSPSLTANSTAGTFTASAAVEHVREPASFQLRNLATGASELRPVGRRRLSAAIDGDYRRPLQVRVVSRDGEPVTGASVTFTLGSSSASASAASAQFMTGSAQASATTGPKGIATSPKFTANSTAGTLTATVTLEGTRQSTRFYLENHAGPPAKLGTGAAASESTTVGSRFAIALAVTVSDAHGNPVPGAPVTFTAPTSGASGSFHGDRTVTVATNKRGIAVAPQFTANDQPGGYVVKATSGHAPPAAFALVNTALGQSS